jgi:hypothetical protein
MMNNKISPTSLSIALLIAVPLLMTQQVQAEIYKCVNEKGTVFYKDKPCPVYDKETQLKSVKDPVNGYTPPEYIEEKESSRSKGVVVGENVENKQVSFDMKDSKKQDSGSSGGGGSGAKDKEKDDYVSDNQSAGGDVSEGVSDRSTPKIAPNLLPRVPLIIEEGAKEPRGKRIVNKGVSPD